MLNIQSIKKLYTFNLENFTHILFEHSVIIINNEKRKYITHDRPHHPKSLYQK